MTAFSWARAVKTYTREMEVFRHDLNHTKRFNIEIDSLVQPPLPALGVPSINQGGAGCIELLSVTMYFFSSFLFSSFFEQEKVCLPVWCRVRPSALGLITQWLKPSRLVGRG